MSWREGMSRAYDRGLKDAKLGGPNRYNGEGFDACYFQGYGHGAQVCRCPKDLAGPRNGQVCVVCGCRRHP